MQIMIRDAGRGDFNTVAGMHCEGISEGFLSSLGIKFLSVLYREIARIPGCGVLVAIEEDKILGFIAYTRDVRVCYARVLKSNGFKLGLAILPSLYKPSIIKRIIETMLYPFRRKIDGSQEATSEKNKPRAELLAMAVDAEARGKGIGKLLVAAVDGAMTDMGINGYYVVTHAVDERSNGFYQSRGFDALREFSNHGKPMREYYKSCKRTKAEPHIK